RKTQREVEKQNRVCSYDRSGIGRSDERPSAAGERTTSDELHALLTTIRFPPPYVLAGHSAGGAYIAEYANAYPDEVVGLVLVDAVPPGSLPPELSDVPLVVLEAGRGATGGWSAAQAESAKLSRNSVHAVALESGHHIQASQPRVVARAIRAAARSGVTGSPLPACADLFARLAVACPAGR
ncbi:MAG: alpha/beta hydrolase, partial [Actinomycetota bacterium]|nr:alpha/beta hydrolase [Actinomycetota bacterium]